MWIYQEGKGHSTEENQQRVYSFFQNRPVYRMNEEICCITNAGKTIKSEWENYDSDFLSTSDLLKVIFLQVHKLSRKTIILTF